MKFNFINLYIKIKKILGNNGDWGLGIGDWG